LVDIALLQSVSYIAGALGVCVAAIYYVMNLKISQRNQEISLKNQELSQKTQELALKAQEQNLETRQAQLFMNIYQTSYSKEYQTARNKIRPPVKDYDEFLLLHKDPEWNSAFYNVAGYYEGARAIRVVPDSQKVLEAIREVLPEYRKL
jgi:hypothetical protein